VSLHLTNEPNQINYFRRIIKMAEPNFTDFNPIVKSKRLDNLTGKTFNRLQVISLYATDKSRQILWLCRCTCKTLTVTTGKYLRSSRVRSCGCLQRESVTKEINQRQILTPEMIAYNSAKGRCNNPNNEAFDNYGGRGIEFRFNSFKEFLSEVGNKPTPKHTIDRIDTDGHYEKGNIRWATFAEQARNRRSNFILKINGQSKPLCDWAESSGISANRITQRIRRHKWCAPCAISIPLQGFNSETTCLHKNKK
jgi:hypothetical protein